MAFGDRTKKTDELKTELDVKAHISFILEGKGVDKVDWYAVFINECAEESPFKIVHGDVKIYYTEKKE